VFSWLLEDHNSKVASHQEEINLIGDAYLIAVAGRYVENGERSLICRESLVLTICSDTTAASLTCLFFQLSMQPECVETLQREIDELFVETTTPEAAALGKLPYLNAVINETLRLHPPVPSGLQRMTPPQGVTIAGTFVPGNTIVQVPTHTIFRGMAAPEYHGSHGF
jgi:cytochrome P450 family 628